MARDAPTSGASSKHRLAADRATIAREISSSGRPSCVKRRPAIGHHVAQPVRIPSPIQPPPPPCCVRRSAARLPQRLRRMARDAPTSGAFSKHRPAADRATIAREISSSGRPPCVKRRPAIGHHVAQPVRIPSPIQRATVRGAAASGRLPCEKEAANPRPPCASSSHVARAHMRVQRRVAVVDRQSGPRSEIRFLRQPALEGLTNSARTETPRRGDRNKSDHGAADDGGRRWSVGTGGGGVRLWRRGRPDTYTCVTLNGSGIQLAVGPQPLRLRNHNFGLAHRIMVKRLATSPHDPLGITDSACKNQLVVVSVQYGPFNIFIPIRSTTIGKSRVSRDPIAMHTSWRSNSDIASVTRVSMTFRVVMTNQYNQDLGLFHSTNGNHLESPNEGSSIDHQVTIHLHAQNITMFPTNETWYFASQMLVSSPGGLILISIPNEVDRSPGHYPSACSEHHNVPYQ
ncbi:Tau class glutathione S-transferase [Dorcoceras hygrometricum]|uniref:Tau class glutathione S-transferase n=1 Tax=Dorcoceras hygrometricum TaxID=472368 RepID=A0A2Z7DEX4_9LAMI|nr:Tau class glutathione S-transferase [Dorcoceras hygrometricum]